MEVEERGPEPGPRNLAELRRRLAYRVNELTDLPPPPTLAQVAEARRHIENQMRMVGTNSTRY